MVVAVRLYFLSNDLQEKGEEKELRRGEQSSIPWAFRNYTHDSTQPNPFIYSFFYFLKDPRYSLIIYIFLVFSEISFKNITLLSLKKKIILKLKTTFIRLVCQPNNPKANFVHSNTKIMIIFLKLFFVLHRSMLCTWNCSGLPSLTQFTCIFVCTFFSFYFTRARPYACNKI